MAEKPKDPTEQPSSQNGSKNSSKRGPKEGTTGRSGARKEPKASQPTRAGTIALVGRPNVGKSTLLNALLGERIAITSHHPQTTRDRIAGIVTRDGVQYVFLDTPGIHRPKTRLGERMNELATAAASDCDVAIFMTDAEVREGAPVRIREEDQQILASIPENKPTILLINKIDKIQPRALLFPLLEAYGALRNFEAVVPISALKTDGMARILGEIGKLLPEGEHLYGEDELSDKPVRFFVSEFVREQILRRTRQEVPHGVAVSVESFEESKDLVRIAVTIHVAKESHKGILIGDGGQMLREIGTTARQRAEQMIGCKVHLQTWIRATPRWFDDPAQLADLGYAEGAEARAKRRSKKQSPKKVAPKAPKKGPAAPKAASTQSKKKAVSKETGAPNKNRSGARGHA